MEKKTKFIGFKATLAEYAAIAFKAYVAQKTMSSFVRNVVLGIEVKASNSSLKAELIYAVNSINLNIEHIAREISQANNASALSDRSYFEILKELQILNKYIENIVQEYL